MRVSATILAAMLLVLAVSGVSAQPLAIYTENNPPASYLVEGRPAGMAVTVVREILRRLNQPDTIEIVPWSRGYNMALTRKNVVLFSTTRLPQREDLFQWAGPLYTQMWGFYAVKGSGLSIHTMDDAKRAKRIGTYQDDAKEQFLKEKGFTNLVSANRNLINVRRLLQGDIDLWVTSDLNVNHIVRQAGEDASRVELVYPFHRVENYIAFSRQTERSLVEAWQITLDAIKADGTYQAIVKRAVDTGW